MAFIDDYNIQVIGPSAAANCKGIQAIISEVISWEKQSNITFKGEKTILVYFTRNADRTNTTLFIIKGKTVTSRYIVKILGVVMNAEFQYK